MTDPQEMRVLSVDAHGRIVHAVPPLPGRIGTSALDWLAPLEKTPFLLEGIADRDLREFPLWRRDGRPSFLSVYPDTPHARWVVWTARGCLPEAGNLEASSVAAALWTLTGRLIFANSALRALLERAEGPGKGVEDLSRWSVLASGNAKTLWEGVNRGIPKEVTLVLEDRREQSRPYLTAYLIPLLAEGHIMAVLGIYQDISADVRKALQEAWRGEQQMAVSITHEVRNPLATVRGFLQLMEQDVEGDLKNWCDLSIREIDRVNRILEDFVALTEPEPDRPEPVWIRDVIASVREWMTVTAQWPADALRLEGSPDTVAVTDRILLTQIVQNLVINGLEAGPPVTVTTQSERGRVTIAVRDQGPGIPEDLRGRILEPFFTTKAKGTGLGLHICRTLARRIGARFEYTLKTAQGGAEFRLVLPGSLERPSAPEGER